MSPLTSRALRGRLALLLAAAFVLASHPEAVGAQTAPKAAPQTKAPVKPAAPQTKAPARAPAPAPKPAAPVAAAPAPPAPPSPQDLRFKTTYTTGGLKTESVTYMKGERERFEFADMVLIKQRDQKRTLQISRAANTYLVVPDGGPAIAMPNVPTAAATPPKAAGVVMVTTSVVDTGERKMAFGREARHVKTTMDKQPMAGACDQTKQRMETDCWYIDVPASMTASSTPTASTPSAPPVVGGCNDEIKATQTGDPKALGFPINYTMTVNGDDGKPNIVAMDITELETTTLDAALFDIPAGFTAAGDLRALSKALSDASEAKLAVEVPTSTAAPRTPGAIRVGVPELTNSSGQEVDTRALRAHLIADLVAAKIEAEPLVAGSQADLLKLAAERGYDYVLVADVTELKVSKGGGLGGALRAASRAASAAAGPAKDPTEATVSLKLIQPDGKARLSTTKKGKDGGGLDMKTGIGVAKFAGSIYVGMLTGRTLMNAMSSMTSGNLSGMGMLGNPALMNMQTRGLGIGGIGGIGGLGGLGKGVDPTAGAASFLMQQAMASDMPAAGGAPGQTGPSFDASLDEALGDVAKDVAESLKKADAQKKK